MSSLLQTRLYQHYLERTGRDLEEVIAWFFEEYIVEEFGASNFSFRPSSGGATYLERVRHLFAEMESVTIQFSSTTRLRASELLGAGRHTSRVCLGTNQFQGSGGASGGPDVKNGRRRSRRGGSQTYT